MTFDKYMDNPSGGQVYTNRGMYKQMYKGKFDAILLRENGRIQYELYKSNYANDQHYVYIKVPSESVSGFYYDTVIEFTAPNNEIKNSTSLKDYNVRFYSNDPAFVYTFAYSFNKNGLFFKDLEPKMSKQAMKQKASTRNPKNDVWYVKSLVFAYLTMEQYDLFNKAKFRDAKKYNKRELIQKVTHADIKVGQLQDAQKKQNDLKKANKSINTGSRTVGGNYTNTSNMSKTSKTSRVSTVSKNSKRTKTTKMVGRK